MDVERAFNEAIYNVLQSWHAIHFALNEFTAGLETASRVEFIISEMGHFLKIKEFAELPTPEEVQEELHYLVDEFLHVDVSDGSDGLTSIHLIKLLQYAKQGNIQELMAQAPKLNHATQSFNCVEETQSAEPELPMEEIPLTPEQIQRQKDEADGWTFVKKR